MIFNCDDAAFNAFGFSKYGGRIQWFYTEQINHGNVDILFGQFIMSFQCFVQGNAGSDNHKLIIIRLSDDLKFAFTNKKLGN
jgi:hypothetical protein